MTEKKIKYADALDFVNHSLNKAVCIYNEDGIMACERCKFNFEGEQDAGRYFMSCAYLEIEDMYLDYIASSQERWGFDKVERHKGG